MEAVQKRPRIALLDEIRGFCVVMMVIHHAFYTLGYDFGVPTGRYLFDLCLVAQPYFDGAFFFICGLCTHLSHSNLKRGLLLAGASGIISLVMWGMWKLELEQPIWFGTLHMLASCILLYALFHDLIGKGIASLFRRRREEATEGRRAVRIGVAIGGVLLCAFLTVLCWHLPVYGSYGGYFGVKGWFTREVPAALQTHGWLFPLGLARPGIGQADYFPLLPWGLIFFAGAFAGPLLRYVPDGLRRPHVPFLSFVGRHALLVYLAHQPVIWAAVWLIFQIKGVF